MKAAQPVLAPRGQPDCLFGCYPVGCEQIWLPRGSQGPRITFDRLGIWRMSVNSAKETLNNACESEDLAAEGMISPVSAPLLRIAGSVSGIG
jgi:hypothetical protein